MANASYSTNYSSYQPNASTAYGKIYVPPPTVTKIPASGYGSQYQNNVTGRYVTTNNTNNTNNTNTSSSNNNPPAQSTYYDPSTGRTFASQDEFNREIDNAYSGTYDYLNQAEANLRADYPNVLAEANANFTTNQALLNNQRDSALNQYSTQQKNAQNKYEDVLSSARRTLNEQRMGANQRFGGSSSAGQAATELQNVEFQRQQGQNVRQLGDLTAQIDMHRQDVEKQHQAGLLQLETQKQSAINQAQRDFQSKLLEITNNRAQVGQAKAQARLAALQNLRNQVFAIEQQNKQFKQTLELQRQQAQLQLGNFAKGVATSTNTVNSLTSGYNPSYESPYGATNGVGQNTQSGSQLVGQIAPTYNNLDPYRLGIGTNLFLYPQNQ